MPHRNLNDIARLGASLKQVTNCKKGKHIILAGFNCPNISWEKKPVNKGLLTEKSNKRSLITP